MGSLNSLGGREWLRHSVSIVPIFKESNDQWYKCHPASFPSALAKYFLEMFMKAHNPGSWVLDPFAGVGSTQYAAKLHGVSSVGIDMNEKYTEIARKRISHFIMRPYKTEHVTLCGDSVELVKNLDQKFDFVFTSPPYHNLLTRTKDTENTKRKRRMGKATGPYSKKGNDLGNQKTYRDFLRLIYTLFECIKEKMNRGGYLGIVLEDITIPRSVGLKCTSFCHGMNHDFFNILTDIGLLYKGEFIWLHNHRNVPILGYPSTFVMLTKHSYIMIFQNPFENDEWVSRHYKM